MRKKKGKKLLIILLCVVLAAAAAAGGAIALKNRGGEVNVYPASSFITSADWAIGAQTDGFVTTEKLQSVYVSSTQQITEIYVREGQTVKTGDPILAFDTTLSQISLERQAIKVDQVKLDIQNARDELEEIGTYRVGAPSVYIPPVDSSLSPAPYMPYERSEGGLGTPGAPLIYLWNDDILFTEGFMYQAVALAMENRDAYRLEHPAPEIPDTPALPAGPDEPAEPAETADAEPAEDAEADTGADLSADDGPDTAYDEPVWSESWDEPADPAAEGIDDARVYVVFEVREADSVRGDILRSWEMELLPDEGAWTMRMIEPDYDPGENDTVADYPVYDTGVYYTAAEISRMKAECTQKIKDLELKLKTEELEYEKLSYELSNGEVYSRIDGVVKTVRDPEEARAESRPVVLVSGGGGYYVTAVLGELELDTVRVGDSVEVRSWESGETCQGTITEVSKYPDESGRFWYYSEGNRNVSTYPFRVFVDEDANLREGEGVTLSYSAGGAGQGGVFLETMFVRQENGRSYIYAAGADGRLEKRFVKTGRNLWGSYLEILDGGLAAEESIAFPYGRDVKDGAKIRFAETEELYAAVRY